MRVRFAFWATAIAVALVAFWQLGPRGVFKVFEDQEATIAPDSKAAFDIWLAEDGAHVEQFQSFERFLASHNVDSVVEPWELTRIERFYVGKCDVEPFTIPPEELWPEIVPALNLVRSHVIPAVGRVQVLSSYRSPELNACARGASRSKHLDFKAIDLATVDWQSGEDLYRKLCLMHTDAGPVSNMGLGAYFDPDEPSHGGGRFHIDAEGYRSWGRDYTSASSPCGRLLSVPT